MIAIRRAQQHESPLLIDIWRHSVDATHRFLSRIDRDEIERQVRAWLPTVSPWVTVDDSDRPVAFMVLSEQHLDALFVAPPAFGKGNGQRLIQHALTLWPALTTEVNEQNPMATHFYAKCGFIITGRSPVDDCGRPYPLLYLRHQDVTVSPVPAVN